jgi:hypothetical protein
MLKSIDILLGLSVVMLMVSLVVTVLTSAVTNFLQTRGKNLAAGLAGLLRQIHPGLPHEVADAISNAILTHPLITCNGKTLAATIHREELTALLLELASDDGPVHLAADVRQHLVDLLNRNGITDPAAVMANVRSLLLVLEQAHPELSNMQRTATAFLQEAPSAFLAKINGWFDQTMDRVADRFTQSTRVITFAASLLVALGLQLDTAALVSRLNADPQLRKSLVDQAIAESAKDLPELQAGNEQAYAKQAELQANLQKFAGEDIINVPANWPDWKGRWNWNNAFMKSLGILLSALLLSLGAPFWYNALKNLVRLRSLMAQKDDDQRTARQTNAAPDSGAAPVPLIIAGERGDLASIG